MLRIRSSSARSRISNSGARTSSGKGLESRLIQATGMPTPWDLRIDQSDAPRRLVLSVLAGPDPWLNTTMSYEIADRPDGGVVVNFDHNEFATVAGVREFTIGWATKILALKKYAETGERDPFFASSS